MAIVTGQPKTKSIREYGDVSRKSHCHPCHLYTPFYPFYPFYPCHPCAAVSTRCSVTDQASQPPSTTTFLRNILLSPLAASVYDRPPKAYKISRISVKPAAIALSNGDIPCASTTFTLAPSWHSNSTHKT